MDIFTEQIVALKKKPLSYVAMVLLVVAAIVLSVFLFIYSLQIPVLILGIVGVIYGVSKLITMFNVEYEYIITNGTVDIDKITAKSTRKRIISFECRDILCGGKYDITNPPRNTVSATHICGNKEDAYYLIVGEAKKTLLVFSPDKKTKNAIKELAQRSVAKELFND